jgi:hypothetical protein
MKVKKEYDTLLDSGELQIMFPQLSGSWKEDKVTFTSLWEQNIEAIKDIDVDFNEFS